MAQEPTNENPPTTEPTVGQENAAAAAAAAGQETTPPAPVAPEAGDLAAKEAELAAREQEVSAREAAAATTLKRAEEVMAQLEAKTKEAKAVAETDQAATALQASNDEKVRIVTSQLEAAHGEEDLGEVVEYKPRVTLSNSSKAGMITFEKGITYMVPKAIVEDLQRREDAYLDYETHLHVREEVFVNAGKISGGGK